MMNPEDLNEIEIESDGETTTIPVELIEAIAICEPIMPLQLAIARLQNDYDDEPIPVIRKNGGPITRSLGDVHAIWVAKYYNPNKGIQHTYIVIYEDDINSVSIDDNYENVD